MKFINSIITTLVSILMLGMASANAAVIYTTTDIGMGLATVDMATGSGPFKGYFSGAIATLPPVSGLAFTPDGTLWTMIDTGSFTYQLATVDKATGRATAVGSPATGLGVGVALAADSAGNLFAATLLNLYGVNMTTGALTMIGGTLPTLPTSIKDMSFDAADVLYAISGGPTISQLYTLDPATGGALTTVTISGLKPTGQAAGLMIDKATGIAYLIEMDATASNLYSLNLTTGAATFIAAISVSDFIPHYFMQQGDIGAAVAGGGGGIGGILGTGGGCSIATGSQFDPTMVLILLLFAGLLLRRRMH